MEFLSLSLEIILPNRIMQSCQKFENPMEYLSNDHKDRPNQHKTFHKLCDKMGHPVVNLIESQRKLIQQHDHNF